MRRLLLGLAMLLSAAGIACAQEYPNRTVRLIVPYAAGGGTDAMARFLTRGMEAKLGVPVIVENRPGSGTTTGANFVAKSAADGYMLLMATSSTVAIAPSIYKNLPYDPLADFTPISMIAEVPFVLITNPALGVDSVDAFLKLARSTTGGLSYASGGAGAPHHIYMELLKSMAGIDLKHVPYRGGGPALSDVVAGHVPVMFADVGQALELITAKKVTALGVTTIKRVETMPQVPTLDQAGIKGYEANSWQCVIGPAKLPPDIVAKLNKVLVEVMAAPETKAHFLRLGMQAGASTPAENVAYISRELARWTQIIKGIASLQP